jgi:hypothetical protein
VAFNTSILIFNVRTRITESKDTGDKLRELAESINMESTDDLITVLMKKVTMNDLRAVLAERETNLMVIAIIVVLARPFCSPLTWRILRTCII